MPTTVTGNPTLVNPLTLTAPVPGGAPVVSLPNDGEPCAVGPIVEAFKQVMSEVAWLKYPIPRQGFWAEAIARFKNYLGHTRFAIDHHGLPAGRIFQEHENWLGVDLVQKAAVAVDQPWAGRWRYDITSAAMLVDALWAGATSSLPSPSLHLQSSSGAVGTVQVYGTRDWVLRSPNQVITWQTELITPSITDIGSVTMEFGLGTVGTDHGVRFVKRNTDANWQLLTNVTGPSIYTDLGSFYAAPSTGRTRLRFELVGANASDDGVARLVLYMNGNQIGPFSYTNAGEESLRPWFKLQRNGAGSGAPFHCYLTTVDVCSSQVAYDVLQ